MWKLIFDTVESTYKSPAYKSHSGYKSRCPLDGICPFFVCIRKKAVQVASIPQNSVYKSRQGLSLSGHFEEMELQLALTAGGIYATGCSIAAVEGRDAVGFSWM